MYQREIIEYHKSWTNSVWFWISISIFIIIVTTAFVGAIMIVNQWNTIQKIDCGCSSTKNNLPILHIHASTPFIIQSMSSDVYTNPGIVSFGDDVMSNPSSVTLNDGYIPLNKTLSGYNVTAWKVPSKGIYELSASVYCKCNIDTQNLTAMSGFCGASNITGNVFAVFALGVFAQVDMQQITFFGSIPSTISAELIAYGGIQTPPVYPHTKLLFETFTFTQIVNITDIDNEYVVGGALTHNNNNAIVVMNRDFTIKKIR